MKKFKIKKYKNVNQRITVRVNPSLYDKICQTATENEVSINSLIVSCIEYAFENME